MGNDTLLGGADDDLLQGSTGNDIINGGTGTGDTVTYADMTGGTGVTVDLAITIQQNTGAGGLDTITLTENLTGSGFADTLFGNSGDNVIKGGAGDDTIAGRLGADTLSGDGGNDAFVFNSGDDGDTITDFQAGGTEDFLDLRTFGFGDFNEVLALATDDGTDTTIDFGNGDTIVLQNVDKTALTANDFLLA